MTDRDTFAAAALTGLMQFRGDPGQRGAICKSTAAIAAEAYDIADAMLRERGDTESMPKEKMAEVSYTLTDEERAAIAWAADNLDACGHGSATLRKLLERLA